MSRDPKPVNLVNCAKQTERGFSCRVWKCFLLFLLFCFNLYSFWERSSKIPITYFITQI